MNIDFGKCREIYGDEVLINCKEESTDLAKSINYLIKLGFNDWEDIIERYLIVFTDSFENVKIKIDKLIEILGTDYVEILENDMGLWEALL